MGKKKEIATSRKCTVVTHFKIMDIKQVPSKLQTLLFKSHVGKANITTRRQTTTSLFRLLFGPTQLIMKFQLINQ